MGEMGDTSTSLGVSDGGDGGDEGDRGNGVAMGIIGHGNAVSLPQLIIGFGRGTILSCPDLAPSFPSLIY